MPPFSTIRLACLHPSQYSFPMYPIQLDVSTSDGPTTSAESAAQQGVAGAVLCCAAHSEVSLTLSMVGFCLRRSHTLKAPSALAVARMCCTRVF